MPPQVRAVETSLQSKSYTRDCGQGSGLRVVPAGRELAPATSYRSSQVSVCASIRAASDGRNIAATGYQKLGVVQLGRCPIPAGHLASSTELEEGNLVRHVERSPGGRAAVPGLQTLRGLPAPPEVSSRPGSSFRRCRRRSSISGGRRERCGWGMPKSLFSQGLRFGAFELRCAPAGGSRTARPPVRLRPAPRPSHARRQYSVMRTSAREASPRTASRQASPARTNCRIVVSSAPSFPISVRNSSALRLPRAAIPQPALHRLLRNFSVKHNQGACSWILSLIRVSSKSATTSGGALRIVSISCLC